jgi:PST family polysaccharide transporter
LTAIRAIVTRELGLDQAGLYHAAWGISAMNMGLVLTAMGAEYFPRLSAAAKDTQAASMIVNQQLRVSLLLAGPPLVVLGFAAPQITQLLYSSAFVGAAPMLQWHAAADVLRIVGWAIGYLFLARQATMAFIVLEATFAVAHTALTWLLVPRFGLEAAGVAFFAAYAFYLPVGITLAVRTGIWISRRNVVSIVKLVVLILALALISRFYTPAAFVLGTIAVGYLTLALLRDIKEMGISIPLLEKMLQWRQRMRERE